MNRYVGRRSHINWGQSETLSGNEIHNWLTVNGTSVESETKAAEYVKSWLLLTIPHIKPKD